MWYPSSNFSHSFRFAVLFLAVGLAGCADFCITGFSVNGSGAVNVSAGNPPPACSLPHVNGMIRAVALKTPVCKTCSTAARIEHLYVTLQGIQLRPDAAGDTAGPTWIEIAPQFAVKPHQIDLVGDSVTELLAENATVPAGSYREVGLQFLSAFHTNAREGRNRCAGMDWNCAITADGQVAALRLPGDSPELRIPIRSTSGSFFVVLPDTKTELRLSLEPQQALFGSNAEGWRPQIILTGHATAGTQESPAPEASN